MANSAGYFSNHSQSRFLANSIPSTTTTTTTTTATATTTLTPVNSTAAGGGATSRPSKHFSTSVVSSNEDRSIPGSRSKERVPSISGSVANGGAVHPLRNTWVFWFRQQRAPGNKIISYEEGIKKISAFGSVESFWSLWTHLYPPSALVPTTDYLLFHSGIRRPVWEDPLNITGGKWIIRLKKGVADRIWEDLVLAILGDQFDACKGDDPTKKDPVPATTSWEDKSDGSGSGDAEWPEICGCTISVRQSEDIVSLWNRVDGDPKLREKIRDMIRRVLNLPPSTIMEYKSNNDSMQDKSSFRNSAIDRSALPLS